MTRILIADDHDVVRSGLSTILGGQPGWEVVAEAEDGRQAVQLAAETKPDVAILDYQLPSMPQCDDPDVAQGLKVNFGTDSMIAAGIDYVIVLGQIVKSPEGLHKELLPGQPIKSELT